MDHLRKKVITISIILLAMLVIFLLFFKDSPEPKLLNNQKPETVSTLIKRRQNPIQNEYVIVLSSKNIPDYSSCDLMTDRNEKGDCVLSKLTKAAEDQKLVNADIFEYLNNYPIEYEYLDPTNSKIFLKGIEDENVLEEIYRRFKEKISSIEESISLEIL
ncbi:hypothetical protein ACFL0Y_00105 [Patescibacteria group bacterium]